jgi:glyoxylase-like metal-dependent hydrolase (beta-lactamase superfamily II)
VLKEFEYDGVTRVEVSKRFPAFPVNFYFVDGLLIDTGNAICAHESYAYLSRRKLLPRTIVNTHYHPDHSGANSIFKDRVGASLYAHRLGIPKLAHPKKMFLFSQLLHGIPEPSIAQEIPRLLKTPNFTFDVIEIPGHCDDHIALYEKKKEWIFTGDLVFEGKAREVNVDTRIYDALESFRKISRLDIETLFGGHGEPLRNPRDLVLSKIEFFEELGRKVEELREEGLDRIQIRKKIFGRERMIAYLCEMKFSTQNLVDSYLQCESNGNSSP